MKKLSFILKEVSLGVYLKLVQNEEYERNILFLTHENARFLLLKNRLRVENKNRSQRLLQTLRCFKYTTSGFGGYTTTTLYPGKPQLIQIYSGTSTTGELL